MFFTWSKHAPLLLGKTLIMYEIRTNTLCLIVLSSCCLLACGLKNPCRGQNETQRLRVSNAQAPYSKEVEAQIKQVENNLAGRVKIEGESWNIRDRMAYYKFNGVSIAVMQDYKIVWAKGYGWADVQEKRPVTENTLFQVASISKSINSMGVLKLVQDKKIDLNTDINQYLTSWQFPYDSVSHGKKISTLNLLTHTGGISGSAPEYIFKDTIPTLIQILNGEASPSRFVYSRVEPARSVTEPGLFFSYSNNGIAITQLMLSDITQKPYEQYIAETVLAPLGMTNSCYTEDSIKSQNRVLASGYLNGMEIPGKHVIVPPLAAGGLWTTPTDLGKFIIELQLSRLGKSNKVLSREMTGRMLTPYIDSTIAPGVFVKKVNASNTGKYFGHSGSLPGFNGQYYGSFEGGNGVVVIVNSGSSDPLIQEIVNSVATVYDWKDFYQPVYKKAVKVPDSTLQKYAGVYTGEEERYAIVTRKEDGYSLFADGTYDKMYFTNETDFFNLLFQTEKHFLKDASGNVTGYTRTLNGVPQLPLTKVSDPAALPGNEGFFGTVGWVLLENQHYAEAGKYLKRGLDLYPNSLMMEMNLAHAYLFQNDYARALKIYGAHLNEIIISDIKWPDMIKSDFVFFNNNRFDKSLMDRVLSDLELEIPEGFD